MRIAPPAVNHVAWPLVNVVRGTIVTTMMVCVRDQHQPRPAGAWQCHQCTWWRQEKRSHSVPREQAYQAAAGSLFICVFLFHCLSLTDCKSNHRFV